MASNEQITVAETTAGKGAAGPHSGSVSLPVVEVLTGRGFITGKSGSGKSNTASVVAEELLEQGFGLLIVDVDGEYYGLKEEFEILHCGADEECDVQVTEAHGERLASLALERNVPIILDVSGFIDEDAADAVVASVAKHLFAKAKKQKQPFLCLVEEVHEYIPENGSVGEAGRTLIKIGKRGRKHGLGMCGISQRPADVKKDFITQCDWLVWHRLTWNNDTKVVRRVLDGEYASAVEDLDDGEGFLVTDWADAVRRVKFNRKRTFDAGATPGLGEVRRPDLKSVSDDLLAELRETAEDTPDDRVANLRAELDEKNSRIAKLEAELQQARDLRDLAREFVDAMTEHVEGSAPGRTEQERIARRRNGHDEAAGKNGSSADSTDRPSDTTSDNDAGGAFAAFGEMMGDDSQSSEDASTASAASEDSGSSEGMFSAFDDIGGSADEEATATTDATGATERPAMSDGGLTVRSISTELAEFEGGAASFGEAPAGTSNDGRPAVVAGLESSLADLEDVAAEMLSLYREEGPEMPEDAFHAITGRQDRVRAYAVNRALRRAGLVEHVGRGHYDYCLRERIEAGLSEERDDGMAAVYARDLEQQFLD